MPSPQNGICVCQLELYFWKYFIFCIKYIFFPVIFKQPWINWWPINNVHDRWNTNPELMILKLSILNWWSLSNLIKLMISSEFHINFVISKHLTDICEQSSLNQWSMNDCHGADLWASPIQWWLFKQPTLNLWSLNNPWWTESPFNH